MFLETVLLPGGSEILTVTPTLPNRQISVLIRPIRNAPVTLRVQVYFSFFLHLHSSPQTHVAVRGFNTNLFVFDKMLNVPRFASFAQLNESSPVTTPVSHVSFRVNEDMTRFISWMQASFILFNPPKVSFSVFSLSLSSTSNQVAQDKLRMNFVSVCGHTNSDTQSLSEGLNFPPCHLC